MKTLIPLLLFLPVTATAQLSAYFNHSVDTTLAYPPGNVARGNIDFSLITLEQLTNARYSIDMAMYSLDLPRVADGLVAAKRRGVKVRVVAHVDNLATASSKFPQLQSEGITVIANPRVSGAAQPLMHNKFFVLDARPGAPSDADPMVVCGSWNATTAQTYVDQNNLLVIRDSAVAGAYTKEFEEMWGSDTDVPDIAKSKFGAAKSDNTDHDFTLRDGMKIEVRFSPSDRTASRINYVISTGQSSIYTANFSFTYAQFARTMSRQKTRFAADVRSIVDEVGDSGSQFPFLQTFAQAFDWKLNGLFHHKYCIIDAIPLGAGSSPTVETGSHNYSLSAETVNDENAVIIHDAKIANQYLQEFAARYREVGGTTPFVAIGGVGNADTSASVTLRAYPNPFDDETTFWVGDRSGELIVSDMLGRECARFDINPEHQSVRWNAGTLPNGAYAVTFQSGGWTRKLVCILHRK